jgi:predicted amidophosphoribosyltransferase
MPYCTYCGHELSDDAKFCRKCGKKVSPESANMCPKCGTNMKKEIYSKALHPFAFNPLGHALGLIKYKERYVCPRCKYKKEVE